MNQKVVFILIASAILFLIDLYVFQAFRTATQNLPIWAQRSIYIVYWLFFLITVTILALATVTRGAPVSILKTYVANVLFVIFVSKLIIVIFLLVSDLARLFASGWNAVSPADANKFDTGRNAFLNKLALVIGGLTLGTFIYGMVRGAFAYQVKRVVLKFPNLPAGFNGYKMLQITDLHTGSFRADEPLKEAVELINKQNADVVFFTGDLVNNIADELQPFMEVLGQIKAKAGVYSVLGNHDYGDYVNWPSREAKQKNLDWLIDSQRKMGWRLLMNEHVELESNGDKIALLGIENWGARVGFPKYGRLDKAYAGTSTYPVKILLSHDPSHWDAEVNPKYKDIDLMLSGHTHGMQFGVNLSFFKWSPVQYVYKQWAGLYKKGSQRLYVNTGLGFLGYQGRVGFLPEITVFELQKG